MTSAHTDIDGVRHGDRALVIKPILKSEHTGRDSQAMLEEAVGLAQAIDLQVVEAGILNVSNPTPATLLGKGQVENTAQIIAAKQIILTVIDHALSPVQQRNLEKDLKCKVIDRTGLILEIFGERARTREGMLQVELAALDYQKSRLVRSWTHLERQRGGFGFLGGPGESQLEIDRRLITSRISRLKEDLEQVRRTRGLQREARQRAEHATIALVGYTNAGKSSLFNRLTGAEVLAKNMLFATLDPTMRGTQLPSGREAILSDTVGFISDLPTHLVEAFRATLEEVQLADIILHVRDVSHPEARSQKDAVLTILAELGISPQDDRLIEVQNKIDLLPDDERKNLQSYAERTTWDAEHVPPALEGVRAEAQGGTIGVSALTGEGIDGLLKLLDDKLSTYSQIYELDVPITDGAALSWLYAHGKIIDKRDTKTKSHIKIELNAADYGRYLSRFRK
ncbi:MAG: GTPase HflX [Alphaproteobacteria bacterium]